MLAAFFRSRFGLTFFTIILAVCGSLPLVFGLPRESIAATAALAGTAVLLFAALPLTIIKYVYKEEASAYGWRLPENNKKALLATLLVLLPHLLLAFYLSHNTSFQEFYDGKNTTVLYFLIIAVVLPAFYFVAEEFLFRGFLLFTLWNKYRYAGVALNIALFALLHISKPPLEIGFAVVSGALLCWLALTTKSFVPAAVVHFATALMLNALIAFA